MSCAFWGLLYSICLVLLFALIREVWSAQSQAVVDSMVHKVVSPIGSRFIQRCADALAERFVLSQGETGGVAALSANSTNHQEQPFLGGTLQSLATTSASQVIQYGQTAVASYVGIAVARSVLAGLTHAVAFMTQACS